jgi:hypothetical protein
VHVDDAGRFALGLVVAGLGMGMVIINRRLGRIWRSWTPDIVHVLSPRLAQEMTKHVDAIYREDRRGRVRLVIAVGTGWVLLGGLVMVLSL